MRGLAEGCARTGRVVRREGGRGRFGEGMVGGEGVGRLGRGGDGGGGDKRERKSWERREE